MLTNRIDKLSHAMNIRLAQQSDLSSVSFIWYERIALLQQTDSYFTLLPNATQVWEQQANLWIEDSNVGFYVAEHESHIIIGYLAVTVVDGPAGLRPKQIGKIIDMGLDLHEAHRSLGGSLLDQAKSWLDERGIRILTVDLPARYPVEEAFWRSHGAKLRFNEFWMVI
jgi:Acetyltransferase (GNAT) family